MKKEYLSAPLPFVGQKRMFASKFKEVLKQYPDDAVYVDLFGGSGSLSHIVKHEKPDATVVYNDYDNYRKRLDNISRTNMLAVGLPPNSRGHTAWQENNRGCKGKNILPYRAGGKGMGLRGLYHNIVLPHVLDEV